MCVYVIVRNPRTALCVCRLSFKIDFQVVPRQAKGHRGSLVQYGAFLYSASVPPSLLPNPPLYLQFCPPHDIGRFFLLNIPFYYSFLSFLILWSGHIESAGHDFRERKHTVHSFIHSLVIQTLKRLGGDDEKENCVQCTQSKRWQCAVQVKRKDRKKLMD